MNFFLKLFLISEPSPKLSIILVTYNHAKTISQSIESILSQETSYSYQIIIIDDFSNDGSLKIIKDYVNKYPKKIIHLRTPKNLGDPRKVIFYLSPNVNGKYWTILEGDDFWLDNSKIQKQLDFLEHDYTKEFIGVTSNYKTLNNDGTSSLRIIEKDSWDIFETLKNKITLYRHTSTYIWRNIYKSKCKKNFFWPSELRKKYTYGDSLLAQFMLCHGGKVKNFPEIMSCYRKTGQGIWTRLSEFESQKQNNLLRERRKKLLKKFNIKL